MTKGCFCICGKEIDEGTLYCSVRCADIAKMMGSPLGLQMDNVDKAYRFFGKQYDKRHKGDDKE